MLDFEASGGFLGIFGVIWGFPCHWRRERDVKTGILLRYLSLSLWRYFDTANNDVTVKRLTILVVDVK